VQTAQLCREADRLARRGLQVLVIESHEPYRIRETLKKSGVTPEQVEVPVLSDPAQTVAATYGVAFQMDDTIEWADRPAVFLIDREGVLRFAYLSESYDDRLDVKDLLAEQARMHEQPGDRPGAP
jgi:peroxiredoxin